MTDEGFLTAVEVARLIGVTDRQVRILAEEKVLPAYRIGSAWRFRRAEIEAWHAQQRNRPTDEPTESESAPAA